MTQVTLTRTPTVYDEIILALKGGARIVRVTDYSNGAVGWSTNPAHRALKQRRGWYDLRLAMDGNDLIVYRR